jgi:hypothetical protein
LKKQSWKLLWIGFALAGLVACRGSNAGDPGAGAAAGAKSGRESAPHVNWTGATERQVQTSHRRIVDDLPRTAERLGWGILRRTRPLPPDHPADDTQPVILLEMLLASERRFIVAAWRQPEQPGDPAPSNGDEAIHRYRVAIVGARVPHDELQQRYLDRLDQTLADKPKPRRGGKFALP